MKRTTESPAHPQIPLDDLSPRRIRDALALLEFIRRVESFPFIANTEGTRPLIDLANARIVSLRAGRWRGFKTLEVMK